MKPSDIPAPLESAEQAAFIKWCRLSEKKYPGLDLIHCSLNGVRLTKGQAGKAKAAGMLAGIPDLFLPVVRQIPDSQLSNLSQGYIYHGLFIEMKRLKGSKMLESQKVIIPKLRKRNYKVVVAKGCDEAIQAIKDYYA